MSCAEEMEYVPGGLGSRFIVEAAILRGADASGIVRMKEGERTYCIWTKDECYNALPLMRGRGVPYQLTKSPEWAIRIISGGRIEYLSSAHIQLQARM